jgi:hypothetical protein
VVIHFKQQFISERSTSMVTKTKKQNATEKRQRVKVGGLKLDKETVKDLTGSEAKKVRGGRKANPPESACAKGCLTWSHNYCPK